MKTALLLSGILFASFSYAQTNVIAAKSHASVATIDPSDPDNFGEFIEPRRIQTVKYLKDACIVETYLSYWNSNELEHDTICDHPFLQPGQTNVERIKLMYPEDTKFEGFDVFNTDEGNATKQLRKEKRDRNSRKSGAVLFFVLGGGLFIAYLFVPKTVFSTSK